MNPTATDSVMDRLDYASIDARMMLGDLRPHWKVYVLGYVSLATSGLSVAWK
ncbi:uncharacterized protein P174DRAFT_438840 [Aspergillus novofumigatus IBT 16806]|uniref:Uncharacterized protein n=1 Tax=Aspergillus novofumigatus (strain IBT 16806) TaxID=1392255 RepID=A0A2I1CHF3_ASPN1|nr:uncharacterized protein P174DRAFT_438840 [Aspergillus novofumigatus IBT 16806]PKX97059.1 hypothetical protein P174DRAFT_438840 [Aspergillus novofumigatus IBT 16806]